MPNSSKIKLHNTKSFTTKYMPSEELGNILKEDISQYFIVRIEEMYRHVKQRVPASRTTTHNCLYVTEGAAWMNIGSESYTVGKNEMLFVPAGQVFSFEPGHQNKGYLFVFQNDLLVTELGKPDFLNHFEFLSVWGNPLIRLNEKTKDNVLHILQRLLSDYTENGLKNTGIIQSYLIALLQEVRLNYEPISSQNPKAASTIAKRFKEALYANVKSIHLVSGYSGLLNVTPNHLNKTVKAVTGKSPTRWIDETLISESKVLLLQSGLSINEIAGEIGFEDPSYFTRLFKKYEGITPTAFRKMIDKS